MARKKKPEMPPPRKVAELDRMAEAARVKKLQRVVLAELAEGNPLAVATATAGCSIMDVVRWRYENATFARDYTRACVAVAEAKQDGAIVVDAAYRAVARGDSKMIQFMLAALFPDIYCPRGRSLRLIDEQARAAAEQAKQEGMTDSASVLLAHLNKLATEKAGLAHAKSSGD